MNDGHALNLVYLLIVLVMALGALSVRRIPIGFLVRALATWAVIIAIVFIGVGYRFEISNALARMTSGLGFADQSVQGRTVRIQMASDGHFWARVRINGVERRMLIDSGATTTALSSETAAAAGISTDGELPTLIDTANGTVSAKRGRIERVEIGSLTMTDVGAVVAPAFGDMDVLGMNFLSRLKSWRVERDTLVLETTGTNESGDGS